MFAFRSVWVLVFSVLMTGSLAALAEEARPQVAEQVLAYSGDQGVKVWTLRIGERSANQALVQIEGIDHDWNMRIQKMNVEKTNKDSRYWIELEGKKYVVLTLQEGYGQMYLPGENQEQTVVYDENLSSQGNAQAFLTDFLEQTN